MITFSPNSWGSRVREGNDCHLPAGSPASTGGQFCSKPVTAGTHDAYDTNLAFGKALQKAGIRSIDDTDDARKAKRLVQQRLGARLKDRPDLVQMARYIGREVGDEADHGHKHTVNDPWDIDPQVRAEMVVANLVQQWAQTSADSSDLAIAIQHAVAQEFGLDGSTTSHFDIPLAPEAEMQMPFLRAFVRAQYDETQALLKEQGIEEVTLFRGAVLPEGDVSDIPADGDGVQVGEATLTLQPMSSFSYLINIAAGFAKVHDTDYYYDGYRSVTVASRIPASRILSTPLTGAGCLKEGEMTVLGGALRGLVSVRSTDKAFGRIDRWDWSDIKDDFEWHLFSRPRGERRY